jgi:peptide/nickel transport system substrate-binding protein
MYQKIVKISLSLTLISLLVACAGQPQSAATVPAATEPPAAPSQPTAAAPASVTTEPVAPLAGQENIFRISLTWDTSSLDPAMAYGSWAGDLMMRMAYDTLVRMRGQPWKPEMLLAESYQVNDDYTVWTFHLRKDAVFHDGSPVTAADVVWSWARIFKLGSGLIAYWGDTADADSAVAVDDQTVQFKLKAPFADFLATMPWFYIINSKLARSHAEAGDFGDEKDYAQTWLATNEAGSGPYYVESFEPNNQHTFAAVKDYWFGWRNPSHMDKIIVKIMPSSSTQKLSLVKGDLEWAGDLEPEDFNSLKDQSGVTTNLRGNGYYILQMNNQKGATADLNVRKAIAYAFDYDSMLNTVIAKKATGLFAPEVVGFVPLDMPYYDLEKAKEYLAKSSYPNGGFEITFNYLADVKYDQTAALLVKEGLEKLNMGIKVNLAPTEWTQYFELCKSADTAPNLQSIELSTMYSISQMLDERYNSKNWGSVTGCSFYKNDKVDQMLASLKENPDPAVTEQIQKIVNEDMPQMMVYIYGYKEAFTSRLAGLDEVYPYPYPPFPQDLFYGQ